MDKRYQVFVSSTFKDLQEERQEIIQALLELDCMPSGMELFPAANDDQWTLIKRVIDDCDYYIVIIGGRYGSIGSGGYSYTEMEYRYAMSTGKPTIAFLHKSPESLPVSRSEQKEEGSLKLAQFRELVQQKMCKYWESPIELGSQVSRSIVQLIKNNPAIGWVRADLLPDSDYTEEILRLKNKIEELQAEISRNFSKAPEGSSSLSQGGDIFSFDFKFRARNPADLKSKYPNYRAEISWDDLFYAVSPVLIDESSEAEIKKQLNSLLQSRYSSEIKKNVQYKGLSISEFEIYDRDFQTIKIQLRALGLIMKSEKRRSVKDTGIYWSLTPYGDGIMTTLRAIKRSIS